MSFFTNLRADRLVTEIRSATDATNPARQKAIARLKDIGPGAIEPILGALPEADKGATLAFVEVLTALVSQKTFPQLVRGLIEGSPRVISGISWALTNTRNYPHSLLLEALSTPGISKSAVLDVIAAQKSRFTVRELLTAAYAQEPNEKAALFRVIGEIADKSSVGELIGRLQGKDPIARVHIINTLARFNTAEVQTALTGLLRDPNKLIRGAALAALQRMDGPIDIERVAPLLRDPEIDVLNRAIDVVIKANHPDTMKYLIEILKDENENARRAAVEVLNEVGNAQSVKYLLGSLKDSDWWVRSRAADALGKIGGPKVIDAVLQLVRDKDEDIRRAAIEILNQTKDERAVDSLIQATRDSDWWVSERAVDALAEIGSKRAVPRLMEMLHTPASGKATPIVVRALGKLGDSKLVDELLPLIARPEREIRIEAIQALSKVTDEARADQVRSELQAQMGSPDQTISRMAAAAVSELDNRIAGISQLTSGSAPSATTAATPASARGRRAARPPPAPAPEAFKTQVISEQAVQQAARQAQSHLAPGHQHAQARGHPRGTLQVHRPHRSRRLRHRAADGRHGGG